MMDRVKRPFIIDSISKESRMSEYQPLADQHLGVFFSNPNIRKILKKAGVVSEKGEVVQKAFRSKQPKIVLPPIRFLPVYHHTSSGNLTMGITKYSTASTGRLRSIRGTDEEPTSPQAMNTEPAAEARKSEPSKKPQLRAPGKHQWGYKTLRPLNHDEYESMLQKYYSSTSPADRPSSPPSNAPAEPSSLQAQSSPGHPSNPQS